MNKIIIQYANKWKMDEQLVFTIYLMIEQSGGKYGKTSRTLKSFKIDITTRQLKYFYRKVRFYDKYQIERKGKPMNYSKLLRNKT